MIVKHLLDRHRLSCIAFDLGAGGTRVCQARAGGAAPTIRDAMKLSVGVRSGDGELETSRLARTVANGDFVGRDVCLVLSPPLVRFTPLHLPAAALSQPAERVESAIKWEAARGQRDASEEVEVRWWRLPRATGAQPNVMAVSLPTSVAMEYHAQLAGVGLRLTRIDVSPCALARSARLMADDTGADVCGILDMGMKQTTLTMVVDGTPVYVRELPLTGPKWTGLIAESLHISADMAETVKRRSGIVGGCGAPLDDEVGELTEARLPGVLFSVLRQPLEALVQEVVDCFSYVFRSNNELHSGRLWLAGGGANLPGLCEYLEVTCGMSVGVLARDDRAAAGTNCGFDAENAVCAGAALLDAEEA